MALTNYEKQKRWREKNRGLYNLQQRNRRKGLSGGVEAREKSFAPDSASSGRGLSDSSPAQSSKDKIAELRQLMEKASSEPVEPVSKVLVYKDDYGRVITEAQYVALQERKKEARNVGYVLDEFSQ